MNISIVDDHRLFASGLAGLLEDSDHGVVATVFERVEDLLSATDAAPDVILLDFYMPEGGGAGGVRALAQRFPDARILVVSASNSPQDRRDSAAAGATGFLSKTTEPDHVIDAVFAAAEGRAIVGAFDAAPVGCDLTGRQIAVLSAIRRGASNKMAARELGMSQETVKSHLSEAFRRLGVTTRTEAVDAAIRRGWL